MLRSFRLNPRKGELYLAATITATPEKRKPLVHQIITDIIIFAPVAAIPAAIVDVVMNPPHGWAQSLLFSLYAVLFAIVGCKMRTLGISLGFHRQGTHPSYQTHPWLRSFFFMLGCSTAQGKMINWLSDHHHHHIHSDQDEDLHSPRHGFWHAYIGWLRGLLFDRTVYPQFAKDKMIMFFSNTFFVWLILGFAFPTFVGWATGFGWYRGLIYGGGLGMFLANYVTYWVNAGCHTFGKRDFNTSDLSTNFWLDGFWGHKLSWLFAYLLGRDEPQQSPRPRHLGKPWHVQGSAGSFGQPPSDIGEDEAGLERPMDDRGASSQAAARANADA